MVTEISPLENFPSNTSLSSIERFLQMDFTNDGWELPPRIVKFRMVCIVGCVPGILQSFNLGYQDFFIMGMRLLTWLIDWIGSKLAQAYQFDELLVIIWCIMAWKNFINHIVSFFFSAWIPKLMKNIAHPKLPCPNGPAAAGEKPISLTWTDLDELGTRIHTHTHTINTIDQVNNCLTVYFMRPLNQVICWNWTRYSRTLSGAGRDQEPKSSDAVLPSPPNKMVSCQVRQSIGPY